MPPQKKLIVIGGGAAGFFCAVNAARLNPGLAVSIIEKSGKLLSKVKISGGGRCNVTHACFDIGEMSGNYPRGSRFVKKTFHRFFTTDTITWFEERGVKLKTENDGRMFPVTDSSQTIIQCLLNEAAKYRVNIHLHAEVKKINYRDGNFSLELSDSRLMNADFLCVASGGYPKSAMFGWIRETGHSIEEPVPSLFTFNMPANRITELMGVSVENARVRIIGAKLDQSGPLLITHWGLSGPAILKLSAWGARELAARNYDFSLRVNWLPGFNEHTIRVRIQELRLEIGSQMISSRNPFGLPQRLWQFLVEASGIKPGTRWAELTARDQNNLVKWLVEYECGVKGKTTFKEEFVTAGGVMLHEVDANTMMSKKIPNLYFAGEVLNVDGITGGYNFQHAWTSGWSAAEAIASR
jgi:predicted Rossmann fold flavoprotein